MWASRMARFSCLRSAAVLRFYRCRQYHERSETLSHGSNISSYLLRGFGSFLVSLRLHLFLAVFAPCLAELLHTILVLTSRTGTVFRRRGLGVVGASCRSDTAIAARCPRLPRMSVGGFLAFSSKLQGGKVVNARGDPVGGGDPQSFLVGCLCLLASAFCNFGLPFFTFFSPVAAQVQPGMAVSI